MYSNSSPYSYAGNYGTSFLNSQLQNSLYGSGAGNRGLVGQQFANVMNSMAGGVTQGAQFGIMPGTQSQMSPQQIAAQMNVAGPMSALPMLGNQFVPRLVYPIAGLWSLYDGMKSIGSMRRELKYEAQNNRRFDPAQLEYQRSMQEMYDVSSRWQHHMGPFRAQPRF